MRQNLLFIFLSCCISQYTCSQSPDFQWVKQIGGISFDDGISIVRDHSGNFYFTGDYTGTVDFDPGPAVFDISSVNPFYSDAFVCKMDAAGNLIWVKTFGGYDTDIGFSLKLDNFENIYVTGYFNLTSDFDPGPGIFNLTSNGNEDIFILKLNCDGNFLWAKSFGSSSVDESRDLCVDPSGNVIITGYYSNSVDFDPGPGIYELTSLGGWEIFAVKFNSDGNFIWARSFGGTESDIGKSITTDSLGNIYITGYFKGISDFDPSGTAYYLTSVGESDIYALKLNSAAEFQWAISIGSSDNDDAYAISTDYDGNFYLAGEYGGEADFDPGPGESIIIATGYTDSYIAKFNAEAELIWVRSISNGFISASYDAVFDSEGNVYVLGTFEGNYDFDPGPGTYFMDAGDDQNIFLIKLTASGDFIWAIQVDGDSYAYGFSLFVDDLDNLFFVGSFYTTYDFDPGPSSYTLTSIGNHDIFFLKLGTCFISIFLQPEDQEAEIGSDVQFITSISAASLQWQENDGTGFVDLVEGGQYTGVYNDTLTINDITIDQINNSYRCIAIDGTCQDTTSAAFLLKKEVGIETQELNPDFQINPNPSSEEITIVFEYWPRQICEFEMFDLECNLIKKGNIESNSTQIDISLLAAGIYFIEVVSGNQKQVQKFVKQI